MHRVSNPVRCRNHHLLRVVFDFLDFPAGALAGFFAAFDLALPLAGAAVASSPSGAASTRAGFGFALPTPAFMVGALPPAWRSAVPTTLKSLRKPPFWP